MPKLSIITPSFQQGAFIEQAIRSVLDQGWGDYEYFVIDGGSSDGTLEIIRRYASRLTCWVCEKDAGQGDALNKGFARATGELIGWINSDDYYLPGAFETIIRTFDEHPEVGMVYGDVLAVDEQGDVINRPLLAQYNLLDLMKFRIINQPAAFFRRDLLTETGGMDIIYHYLLDHHLWLRIANKTKMLYLSKPLAAARYHAGAKNLCHADQFGREAFQLVDWMARTSSYEQLYRQHQRAILAGAYRLNGYYLSEAGQVPDSLRAYWSAFKHQPVTALADWRRVLYTLSMPFFGKAIQRMARRR